MSKKTKRSSMLVVLALTAALAFVLCACTGQGTPSSSPSEASARQIATPAYYVFESYTDFSGTVTDPNQLVLDGEGGPFKDWHYLSIALLDGQSGKLCTFGNVIDFAYDIEGDVITLHASTNEGADFGFDGEELEVGDGTLTLTDGEDVTVLRHVEEPPAPFK